MNARLTHGLLLLLAATSPVWCEPMLPPGGGENIALGRPVAYSVQPNNPGELLEASKLTDGKRTADPGFNWPPETSVGFHYPGYGISSHRGINMVIDLGEIQPVHGSRVTLFNASAVMAWWRLPKRVTIAVSRDGKTFHHVQTWEKLTAVEPGIMSSGTFAVNERDRVSPYDLGFDLRGIEARYVALNIVGESFVFWVDEWEVFGASPHSALPQRNDRLYGDETRFPLPMGVDGLSPGDTVLFGPAKDYVAVSTTIPAPQYIDLGDYRSEDKQPPLTLIMELPAGIRLLDSPLLEGSVTIDEHGSVTTVTIDAEAACKTGLLRATAGAWSRAQLLGPLFLGVEGAVSEGGIARFHARSGERAYAATECPVRTIAIPDVPRMEVFPIGLSWMTGTERNAWPEFLENYQRLGFNNVRVSAGDVDLETGQIRESSRPFIEAAEATGLKLTLVDGATHRHHRYKPDAKCTNETNSLLCPSYFGEGFDATLNEVKRVAEALRPHSVWWNIEAYGYAQLREGCTRCDSGIKSSGLSPLDYFRTCGQRILEGLRNSLEGDDRLERVGMYDLWPTRGGRLEGHGMHDADTLVAHKQIAVYHETFLFEDAYPQALNTAMPHLYCAGLVDVLHTHMARPSVELLDRPWPHVNVLSTGTFGEFASFKVEQMIYEQVLNEGGIDFYRMADFDTPMDFHYFAKALRTLGAFEALLAKGRCMPEWKGLNRRLYYTAFGTEEEALLLIGNYNSPQKEYVRIQIQGTRDAAVEDVLRNAPVEHREGTVLLEVPVQGVRLLHVRRTDDA